MLKIIFLFLPLLAHAEIKKFDIECKSVARMSEFVFSCADMSIYSEAGVDCLERLESYVSEQKRDLDQKFKKALKATSNSQSAEINTTTKDYQASKEALTKLIANAKFAKLNVQNYIKNIAFPRTSQNKIPDVHRYLTQQICYADTRTILGWVVQDIDQMIKDFEKGKIATNYLKSKSQEKYNLVNSDGSAKAANTQSRKPASNGENATGTNRGSDVSGMDRLEKTKK